MESEFLFLCQQGPQMPRYWARWIQSTPIYTIPLRGILILSTHLRLGLSGGLFPLRFPTKILLGTAHGPNARYMACKRGSLTSNLQHSFL
jgi:hypothetical protein